MNDEHTSAGGGPASDLQEPASAASLATQRKLTLTLTRAQVAQVVRDAAGKSAGGLLGAFGDPDKLTSAVLPIVDDPAYSRSTLRALLVLGAFPTDGTEREVTEIARQLSLNASTAHRYISTWLAVGVLEQDPVTRRYRRASIGDPEALEV